MAYLSILNVVHAFTALVIFRCSIQSDLSRILFFSKEEMLEPIHKIFMGPRLTYISCMTNFRATTAGVLFFLSSEVLRLTCHSN